MYHVYGTVHGRRGWWCGLGHGRYGGHWKPVSLLLLLLVMRMVGLQVRVVVTTAATVQVTATAAAATTTTAPVQWATPSS